MSEVFQWFCMSRDVFTKACEFVGCFPWTLNTHVLQMMIGTGTVSWITRPGPRIDANGWCQHVEFLFLQHFDWLLNSLGIRIFTYIFYIWQENQPNLGKYARHASHGVWKISNVKGKLKCFLGVKIDRHWLMLEMEATLNWAKNTVHQLQFGEFFHFHSSWFPFSLYNTLCFGRCFILKKKKTSVKKT